ncbi:ketopantoate reductase family protein [Pontibacter mangrovi]|uniref:2-dehydropantoate 2-reductase n=1 Tax=Pontibacter mangrovi TaxID=2589816 RepID=A0A501W7A0_9BACT|nr:2-dehydropantoate 2-reductase [Pontibacter mangrovi]TPE45813.1 2-dehydropantoate 2-reductase [Pontibacter mangrovi]
MENQKYRIAVVGIGGVGGYYGGRLAQRFAGDDKYEIIFVARGAHKEKIEQEGLKLELEQETLTVLPDVVTDKPGELGQLDLILFCVKSYSLEQVAEQFAPSITSETMILPLLNGVESIEYLQRRFPEAQVLWGCVYIISSIKAPGVVQVQGKYNRLVWGNPKLPQDKLQHIKWLFDDAGINHEYYEQEVEAKVWEKFSFISPVASLTSLTHQSMGRIMEQEPLRQQLQQLMQELVQVAKAKGIHLPQDMVARNLAVVEKLPQGATSSMERDFADGNRTELENLTGYIVREAEKYRVEVPIYEQVYRELKGL